jgi:phage baseplate assembly protein gpV/phage protein D
MKNPVLFIDGARATSALAGSLVSLFVRQGFNAPALAVLTFADRGGTLGGAFPLGAAVAVDAPDGTRLIDGEVTTVDHLLEPGHIRTLRVHAFDRLHRLRKTQQVRALANVTIDDLLGEAARSIDLTADATASGLPARPLLIQSDENDLDLLVLAAGRQGLYVRLASGSVRALTLAGDGREPIHLTAGGNLYAASASVSSETMRQNTAVQGWDWRHIKAVAGQAALARQDAGEIGPDPGAALTGRGKRVLVNRLVAGREEADAAAQADMDRAAAFAATLSGTAEGDPGLEPGRLVRVEGLGGAADRLYVLTETTHSFSSTSGYVTEIGTAPPPARPSPATATSLIGRVTDTADPEALARVRCVLPAVGAVETDWMPVLSIGAGPDKGLSILPEPDDDVLILLPDGDPSRGIVLGGLYGTRHAPGERPMTGARGFCLRTPGGQVLSMSSEDSHIRLETQAGDLFEFGPDGSRLSARRDLTIEAPGQTLTIRARAINFEQV